MTHTDEKSVETEATAEAGHTAVPRANVYETENEFVLTADMPGVAAGDVDVRFEKGELTVFGRRAAAHPDKARIGWESDVTGYARTFRLGDQIAADRIEAALTDGVLTLRLPKVEAVKPKRIAVTVK